MSEQNNGQMPAAVPGQSTAAGQIPQAPGWLRGIVGVLGALIALSALGFAIGAVVAPAKPAFQMLGFEIVALVAGVMGVWMARGGGANGFGLGVLGIAGAVGAGVVLSYMSVTGKHDFARPSGMLGSIPLWPWFYLRVLSAAALAGVAAVSVLNRNPKSYVVLAKGLLMLIPAAAAGGYAVLMIKNGQSPVGAVKGAMAVVATTAILVAGVAVIALISAGGHMVIRAFEMGRRE